MATETPARARKLVARLLMLAKPEWRSLSLGVVCLVIASSANLVFPQAIRVLVDGALASGTRDAVDGAALFMFVIGVVSAAAGATRYVLFTVAGERIVARLRRDA